MTLKEYRLMARWSLSELARNAHIDYGTAKRAETGQPIQEVKAVQIAEALSIKLGQKIGESDIDGLVIFQP